MEWWNKMMLPLRRVWFHLAARLGIRKSGLLKLKHDVRTCEYEDVHVMWEMLKRSETESSKGLKSSSSTASISSASTSSSSTPNRKKSKRNSNNKMEKKQKPLWKTFICASRGPQHLCGTF
ncbi:hypothetical protein C5167_024499 [Papaver somniferum]|uniref:Uncharacterized protein n=1 Tax=Papaver somniferum TaxID=3469 RepID=A0A4Y7JSR9_PAPSO|nr:uncharacterized protein LOC113283465 [Papaver somniferum]RZC62735.1 hypothetical protein C5167_024499 [Papaver somniferum]